MAGWLAGWLGWGREWGLDGFGSAYCSLNAQLGAERTPRKVTTTTFESFKENHPNRFFNCGVAEQNMTGMAAGLAKQGFLPVTYTIAPFCTTRCLEQIKIDIAYHNLPVTIVSVGSGLSYAGLGPTHHTFEDIAFLRAIPNMRILNPADPDELEACLALAFLDPRPTYIRMGKKGEPNVHGRVLRPPEILSPILKALRI
mgnify:CR=1 FL=1